jgi:putative transposase
MKKSRFTETQIVSILKEADAGMKVEELCRKHGISSASYYNWKKKYGGMDASEIKRLKELEEESAKLKRMYADMALENTALKDLIVKKGW